MEPSQVVKEMRFHCVLLDGAVCFKTSSPLSNDRCGCHFSLLC